MKDKAKAEAIRDKRQLYRQGGLAYSEIKQELYGLLEETFGPYRRQYASWLSDRGAIDAILRQGAETARQAARPLLRVVRRVIGIQ